jgi:hypothetical protein
MMKQSLRLYGHALILFRQMLHGCLVIGIKYGPVCAIWSARVVSANSDVAVRAALMLNLNQE